MTTTPGVFLQFLAVTLETAHSFHPLLVLSYVPENLIAFSPQQY